MASREIVLMLRSAALIFLLGIALFSGCASVKPLPIAMEPGASLKRYHTIAVAPVSVDSDAPVTPLLAAELRLDVEQALADRGYQIVNYQKGPADTLIIQCEYVSFAPGNFAKNLAGFAATQLLPPLMLVAPNLDSAGSTEASVTVTLSDKASGKPLGDLVVNRAAPAGANAMQHDVAAAIADAIDTKIKAS